MQDGAPGGAGKADTGGARQKTNGTVSIYLRGAVWWTWLRCADGQFRRVSTKVRDEVAAREVAISLQRAEAATTERQATWSLHRGGKTRVYFVQAGADGPIKIGVAVNPVARIEMMQSGNHLKLTIVGECSGGLELERSLHERLKRYRIRGEWFYPAAEVLAAIREKCPMAKRTRRAPPTDASQRSA